MLQYKCMAQVTIYLDSATEKQVRRAAKAQGVSLSKWIAAVLRAKTQATWPAAVWKLEGAWPDFPEAEELRKLVGSDIRREEL